MEVIPFVLLASESAPRFIAPVKVEALLALGLGVFLRDLLVVLAANIEQGSQDFDRRGVDGIWVKGCVVRHPGLESAILFSHVGKQVVSLPHRPNGWLADLDLHSLPDLRLGLLGQ